MDLKQSKTFQNIVNAYAGEVQAGARYQFAADKAMKEGYPALSDLIRTQAKNEMAHAKLWFDTITNCESECIDNLTVNSGYPFKCGCLFDQLAKEAENEGMEADLYTKNAQIAEDEGFPDIARKMRLVAAVEVCHNKLFAQIAAMGKGNKMYKKESEFKWKCSNCGHEATLKEAWKVCPLCGEPQGAVMVPVDSE